MKHLRLVVPFLLFSSAALRAQTTGFDSRAAFHTLKDILDVIPKSEKLEDRSGPLVAGIEAAKQALKTKAVSRVATLVMRADRQEIAGERNMYPGSVAIGPDDYFFTWNGVSIQIRLTAFFTGAGASSGLAVKRGSDVVITGIVSDASCLIWGGNKKHARIYIDIAQASVGSLLQLDGPPMAVQGGRYLPISGASVPAAVSLATVETDAGLPRISVIKEQGPNATEWALTPLDEAIPQDIRQNLTFLREDLLDEAKKSPKSTAAAYTLASTYCDKILAALDLRDQARVKAGYRAAQADANKTFTNQALSARRNYKMSWPQYAREESQRAALRENETEKADVKKEGLKVEWNERAQQMRAYLDTVYRQLREAMR
ncbi:MAG TPA: hypothetical protein VGE39_26185 [Prosthecobacter sp.]